MFYLNRDEFLLILSNARNIHRANGDNIINELIVNILDRIATLWPPRTVNQLMCYVGVTCNFHINSPYHPVKTTFYPPADIFLFSTVQVPDLAIRFS